MKVFSRGPISHNGLPDLYPTTFSSLKPQFPLVESCNQENVRFVMFSDFFQLFFQGRIQFTTVPTLTPLSKVQSRTCMSTEKIIVLVMQQKRRRNISRLYWFAWPSIIKIYWLTSEWSWQSGVHLRWCHLSVFQTCYGEASPVPELSFLPAPYRGCSAPIWSGKKGEFRDWTMARPIDQPPDRHI